MDISQILKVHFDPLYKYKDDQWAIRTANSWNHIGFNTSNSKSKCLHVYHQKEIKLSLPWIIQNIVDPLHRENPTYCMHVNKLVLNCD
jgi:hypothetical protein